MEANTTGIKTLEQTKVALFLVITKLKKGQQGVSSKFFLRNQKRAYSMWNKPVFATFFFFIKEGKHESEDRWRAAGRCGAGSSARAEGGLGGGEGACFGDVY